ncbi:phosphotransferase [Kribbella sandramycini]|uniref:Phosphotransferase n=1 Tax=Kribbella sandramycini TaxID=60450 RepID=A0A7Y4KZ10_9ACTN|nr:phosphotransferase [Kribbella sandramycini]MBB6565007.1 putative kinase [Kribbella sandramycini]NOL41279.1 phosphotransferase [Kribbella sandramycini]
MESEGVIVVSGIMAAGKTAVSHLLAERFQYGVHLPGSLFRRMIVSGLASMAEDPVAAQRQMQLGFRLACTAADQYAEAGFTVVLQDVVIGELLREFLDGIRTRPRYLVVLTPRPEVVSGRLGGSHHLVDELDYELHAFSPRRGLWLDNSDLSAAETVDAILGRLDEARFE